MIKYPSKIISNRRYKRELDITSLIEVQELFIVRRIEKLEQVEILNRLGRFNSMAINVDQIPGLSMNLLGGVYHLTYLKFNNVRRAAKSWSGDNTNISFFNNDVELIKDKSYSYFFLPVSVIHNVSVPFSAANNAQARQAYPNFTFEPAQKVPILNYQGHTSIDHAPSHLNYWHVELNVYSFADGQRIKNAKNPMNKSACEHILNHLILHNIKFTLPGDFRKIPKSYYHSGKHKFYEENL